MRHALAALAVVVAPIAAPGQTTAPIIATPLPPVDQSTTPQPPTPAAPPAAQPSQTTWLPQASAQLQVLDKVNAQTAVLTVKVGESAQVGSLTIQVQACDTHPPDQPQDATAFLTITDSHADAPGFRGWMLANNPSLSMLQHPIYDVRVVGCKV